MDLSSLKNGKSEGTWYPIPGDQEARIKIRRVSPGRLNEINNLCTAKKFRRGNMYEETDDAMAARLLMDDSIVDWEGITDNGQSLEVNTENKVRLCNEWTEVAVLWNAVINKEIDAEKSIRTAELGN